MRKLFIVTAIVTIATLAACKPKNDSGTMLSAHEWELDEIVYDGNDFTETPPAGVTVMFADSTGRVSGSGGCNRFSAPYKLGKGDGIELGAVAATQMACLDMEFESKYFKLLENVDGFKVEENALELRSGADKATLVYKPILKAVQ